MSPWFPRWKVATPCLVVETDQGLALVDTGMGVHDYTKPSRMVRFFIADFGIPCDPRWAAINQLEQLGYPPESVRHIILTHLHFDHAGGLPDFPHAQVHLHRREYEAMRRPRRLIELAYDPLDFAHKPKWVLYDKVNADWQGLEAIRLPFMPEIYLIPLFGHTRGLCGVAIQDGAGWIFQCSDAIPIEARFDLVPGWLMRMVLGAMVDRMREWGKTHPDIRILAGHEFERIS